MMLDVETMKSEQLEFESEQKRSHQIERDKFIASVATKEITSAKDIADGRDFYGMTVDDLIEEIASYRLDLADVEVEKVGIAAAERLAQLRELRPSKVSTIEEIIAPHVADLRQHDHQEQIAMQAIIAGQCAKIRRAERCRNPIELADREGRENRLRELEVESVEIRRELDRTRGDLIDARNNFAADSDAFSDVSAIKDNVAFLEAAISQLEMRADGNRAEAERLNSEAF